MSGGHQSCHIRGPHPNCERYPLPLRTILSLLVGEIRFFSSDPAAQSDPWPDLQLNGAAPFQINLIEWCQKYSFVWIMTDECECKRFGE
ncbi:hypothetical protein XELAEV_18003577mg [Xenopus laevis]|nr:hypothetical protein XELAEV_18003577mg [Xenopus laevis]